MAPILAASLLQQSKFSFPSRDRLQFIARRIEHFLRGNDSADVALLQFQLGTGAADARHRYAEKFWELIVIPQENEFRIGNESATIGDDVEAFFQGLVGVTEVGLKFHAAPSWFSKPSSSGLSME